MEKIKKTPVIDKRILSVGNKLKKLRNEAGYTSYEDFAFEKELNRVQYWRLEKGVNFTFNSLLKVLDAHKITVSEFFKDIEKY
jgi:transcriptional regulator with XRE-family HTH domain